MFFYTKSNLRPTLMTQPFRRESNSSVPQLYAVFEVDWPSPTGTKRYSNTSVSSVALGPCEPLVKSFGPIAISISPRTNNLASLETNVDLNDKDRTIAKLISAHKRAIRRSPTRIKIVSPNVSNDCVYTAFSGVIESFFQSSPFVYRFRSKPDDLALLNVKVLRAPITSDDYAEAPSNSLGQFLPLLYGKHSSAQLTGKGAIPLIRVGTGLYVVCLLRALSVDNVYKDGVIQSSGFSTQYSTRGGKTVTEVLFTSDPGENVAVTADVQGYETSGVGTGTLITNPAQQLAHLLTQFVWSDTRLAGAWLPYSSNIDSAAFSNVLSFFSASGYSTSRRISTATAAIDVLNEWLDNMNCKAWWTNLGKLAIGVLDHRTQDIYQDQNWIEGNERWSDYSQDWNAQRLVAGLTAQYLYLEADSKYQRTLKVKDLGVPDNIVDSVTIPWSGSFV